MAFRKSVPKPLGVGAGAPNPKKGDVNIIFVEDILSFPGRDANGVKMIGDIVLKANAKVHKLYETPTSQKASHTIEGDEDAEQFKQKFEGTHPGDSLEINEFVQNVMGQGVIIVYGVACGSNSKKVLGTPCNPMKLKGEFSDDKDGVKHTLNFEQYQGGGYIAGFYTGALSYVENEVVADAAAVTVDPLNKPAMQLPATSATTAVTIATILNPAHGQTFSLIGGGGSNPATLAAGAIAGIGTLLLKEGTSWIALKDAVITLQIFKSSSGSLTLLEVSRGA